MTMAGLPLSGRSRDLVARAADGFLPLQTWVGKKTYNPEPASPWRNGARLDATALAFADFFERLLRETSRDADIKARWDAFAQAPMGGCPIPGAATWRANRGLSPTPIFAITVSDAVIVDTETRQISRAEFYAGYWHLLDDAYAAADSQAATGGVAVDEQAFALALLNDNNAFWPQGGQWRSSRFAKQFVKDVLYGYLGLKGLAPAPWSEAVLTELGERRRVGNSYTSADAANAVANFTAVLKAVREQGAAHPLAEPDRKYVAQPVGSPPVNARDL